MYDIKKKKMIRKSPEEFQPNSVLPTKIIIYDSSFHKVYNPMGKEFAPAIN